MDSSRKLQLKKSTTEKYMGHKLALYTTPAGVAWVSIDGVIDGPYDTLEDAEKRLERQRDLYRLAFYARSHREASRRP
jgi:hypothetical protein